MGRMLSYADAVKILGGDGRSVAALDRLAGGLLLAATGGGSELALSLFDAKGELARISQHLVTELSQKLRGLSRFDRTERLAAAHAVIVVVAYFEALSSIKLPFSVDGFRLRKSEQVALATGGPAEADRIKPLVERLLRRELPMPEPHRPYEENLKLLRDYFGSLSAEVSRFVTGLAVWERLNDDTRKERFTQAVLEMVPDLAVTHYEQLFRRLATDFPEVTFWANLVDHQATREDIERLRVGLAGLERVLTEIAAGKAPDERRASLTRFYQAALELPIAETGELPAEDVQLPSLGEAYVNSDFRAADVQFRDHPHIESWWDDHAVRADLQGFLIGYLTSKRATQSPLVVLGQPGSGKSVLTKILAARLPPSEFLTVRVVLRDAPAEADIQTQIEHEIRSATGEIVSWPDLVRTARGVLPVVLLDGFDELLQATGVSQSDYLERIAEFQQREAVHGRPVVVLVTSRTVVADRARVPTNGMVVVRLEPFRETHVAQWLKLWNDTNSAYLDAHHLSALSVETVLVYPELATQPLLLLMLALYDADGNALQQAGGRLRKAQLYERLLIRFAEREVRKTHAGIDTAAFQQEVDQQLSRLAIAAFAMFNRSRQWVIDSELEADLAALLPGSVSRSAMAGFRTPLSAAQVTIGHFFFIHESQATRDNERVTACEFLHATFGEFLVAWLVARELDDLAKVAAARTRYTEPHDGFIYALLSFAPLTARATTMSFLLELVEQIPQARRDLLRDLLLSLFRSALDIRREPSHGDYEPVRLTAPSRCANYSANLLLLIVTTGGEVTGHLLFPEASNPVVGWRRIALLWRSRLSPENWASLVAALVLNRVWDEARQDVVLTAAHENLPVPPVDPYWTHDYAPNSEYRGHIAWQAGDFDVVRREGHFLCDLQYDAMMHALEPLADATIRAFAGHWDDHCVSAAHALIRLWVASGVQKDTAELTKAYDDCLTITLYPYGFWDSEMEERYRELVLRQITLDKNRLPEVWRQKTRRHLEGYRQDPEVVEWAERVLAELGFTLP
jgi:hypothetical protein